MKAEICEENPIIKAKLFFQKSEKSSNIPSIKVFCLTNGHPFISVREDESKTAANK